MGFGLRKCDPLQVVLREDIDGLFGDFWAPLIDVEETKDEIIVKAQLPGLKREEIKLQVQQDALVISGERKAESETEEKTVHLVETVYGKFQRVLGLPVDVKADSASATYEAGILTVRLPKAEEAKPKEISIEVK